jgi:hypothetical protein
VPQVGERVFVTFTEEQARPLAVKLVDKYWNDSKYPMSEHPEFADSKESAVEKMIASWIADWGGYSPHVVEVTPAMHAQFRARAEEIHKLVDP